MKKHTITLVALIALLIASNSFSQPSGSTDLPSIGTQKGAIFLSNPTNGKVFFALRSQNTPKTQHYLEASEDATFEGSTGDNWFNITYNFNNRSASYRLEAGSRYYFEWRDNKLELFRLPPKSVRPSVR